MACELHADNMTSKLILQLQQESGAEKAKRTDCTVVFTTVSVRQWEIAFSWYWGKRGLKGLQIETIINRIIYS